MSIITFKECYVPRMWGGETLRSVYGKPLPDESIGEAWLISDHPQHTSVVKRGYKPGTTLHELIEGGPLNILGARAALTVHGRFPLLLKLLDARKDLSIQVHPDDAIAARLNEDDCGKSEMWHILQADSEATLYCGLAESLTPEALETYLAEGSIAQQLNTIQAEVGMSVFIPAGTIHSIGEGCLLAEIQQNSDLTYRMDDWGRVDVNGKPRELHLEKAKQSVKYPNTHPGAMPSFEYQVPDATVRVLTACPFFAAEEIVLEGKPVELNRGETFHIVLAKAEALTIETDSDAHTLSPGEAALIPSSESHFTLSGKGSALLYYVPDIEENIVAPLVAAGYSREDLSPLLES